MLDRSPTTMSSAPIILLRVSSARAVQYDVVALLDQKLGGHLSEAVGGAGYEDACHSYILSLGRSVTRADGASVSDEVSAASSLSDLAER
jgi:hypothetical protein